MPFRYEKLHLLPVNYVPLFGFSITVNDIPSLKITFAIPRIRVRLGVVKVCRNYRWPSDTKLAPGVIICHILAVIINQSIVLANHL